MNMAEFGEMTYLAGELGGCIVRRMWGTRVSRTGLPVGSMRNEKAALRRERQKCSKP